MVFYFTIHIIICILLVAVILFQDGKAGGLTSVADSSQVMFGAKGAASFLTKLTSGLALAFFVSSMSLAYFVTPSNRSIAADFVPEQTTESTVEPAPSATESDSGIQQSEVLRAEDLTDEQRKQLGLPPAPKKEGETESEGEEKPEGENQEPPKEENQ